MNVKSKDTIFDGSQFDLPQLRLYLSRVLSEVQAFSQGLLDQLIL